VTSGGGAPGSIATPSAGSGTADGSQDAYRFRGKQYVRSQGGWFESRGSQLVQVAPPVGLAIDSLPANHETRWIDGVPYFVASSLATRTSSGASASASTRSSNRRRCCLRVSKRWAPDGIAARTRQIW